MDVNAENERIRQDLARKANWKRWGPYLSERQWGTVREDYSPFGTCWTYFPHDHARSRAYRWGEDGLLGITDRECRICFALALWNGQDPILKERLFGLTGPEGNHGEDVKELYYYLDSTPTHSYLKALYKYPQTAYPYNKLVEENERRTKDSPEFELLDTGVFEDDRYFDVQIEYAKGGPEDIWIRITVTNRAPQAAQLDLIPQLWCRNTWSWGKPFEREAITAPRIVESGSEGELSVAYPEFGTYRLIPNSSAWFSRALFTENETNSELLYGVPGGKPPYYKDAFHRYIVSGEKKAVNPSQQGSKAALLYQLNLSAGESAAIQMRLTGVPEPATDWARVDQIFDDRIAEADAFYAGLLAPNLSADEKLVARQAFGGVLWTKQFYHYVVETWLDGDPEQPKPPPERENGRNHEWRHVFSRDLLSMPDKWEYPWFAAWDLAFHTLPLSRLDPSFAKGQLLLLLREWYMHPNGQIPAYEFAFGDVNPPVHAWAAWRVYKTTGKRGRRDLDFLERVYQKLLLNFTWWVNRKDAQGKNLFTGGFLGLDNIGVFDRSGPAPYGGELNQADATAWMAFFCGTMMSIALELASVKPAYEDIASKFFEHFVAIIDAVNSVGGSGLWNDEDGFYYDQLRWAGGVQALKVRSIVGIIPLFAVEILRCSDIAKLKGFRKRMEWFQANHPRLAAHLTSRQLEDVHYGDVFLLAIPPREHLVKVLRYVLDEREFLSDFGIRSVSRFHKDNPYEFWLDGQKLGVDYEPGESTTGLFGGNSNWRGPVWFPINFLLIEALERYHLFYGDELKVECPVGSGELLNLQQVSEFLVRRLSSIFLKDKFGRRPCHGEAKIYSEKPSWNDLILFYEYFHGDTGRGVGASHQTGWTSLIADCLHRIQS
ncbi:MAG: glucosidase [Verrucomicrobia bacterium]|nr:glucosidase [Verrucomicrobiota bacterium]